jgi:hypothetical protein
MDPKLFIAQAALQMQNTTLAAEAGRSQNFMTKQIANAGWLPNPGPYPDWLPTAPSGDRPDIYSDFVNGHYWAAGSVRTLTNLWGSSSITTFNPASVVPGSGLDMTTGAPSLQNPYFLEIAGGATVVVAVNLDNVLSDGYVINVQNISADFANSQTVQFGSFSSHHMQIDLFPPNPNGSDVFSAAVSTAASMALAATFQPAQTIGSLQGGAVYMTANDPSETAAQIFAISCGADSAGYVTTVAIYQPQPDSDLPTLSTP